MRSAHELIGNAVKHGMKGRPVGRIAVRLVSDASGTVLTVTDHGLEQAVIDDLIEKAHQVCPYSNATRNNVDVRLSAK